MLQLSCSLSRESRLHLPVKQVHHGCGMMLGERCTSHKHLGRTDIPVQLSRKQLRSVSCTGIGNADSGQMQSRNLWMEKATSAVQQFDFAVIGSGIAGLSYALKVAEFGTVAVITKAKTDDGCTKYAQGGVCAVLDAYDSVEAHVADTMTAGAYLNDPNAVQVVCHEGPARVLELVKLGTNFSKNKDGSLHLTREGGHSGRRIVHAADATGKEIEATLVCAAKSHRNIKIFEHHLAVDLVVEEVNGVPHCFGVDVLDQANSVMTRFVALSTMLSSGGAGQIYPNTTNPSVATGDGIAIAHRANAHVANMEFVQFHPTSLYTGTTEFSRAPLVTEAVRGEGGLLYNLKGERFMPQYDDRGELAPRDIVARAIQDQMLMHGDPHVMLDISHKPRDDVLHHFPNVAARCREIGVDMTRDAIPVLPAQHYLCGGVRTGLLGETSIQGLFACGEVACTGLHGANRLASNSLLEALVFADRAVGPSVANVDHALRNCNTALHEVMQNAENNAILGQRPARPLPKKASAWIDNQKSKLRSVMWKYCGIVRSRQGLSTGLHSLCSIYLETKAMREHFPQSPELAELLNMVTVGELVMYGASSRKKSRGLHFMKDSEPSVTPLEQGVLVEAPSAKRYEVFKERQNSWQTPLLKHSKPLMDTRQTTAIRSSKGRK